MNKIILLTWLYLISQQSSAQYFRAPVVVQTDSYSSSHYAASSFCGNQAAFAGIKKFSAVVYSEQRFMLKELASYHVALVLPTSTGNFGLSGIYFGSSSYNETGLGLAYAKKLGRLDLGVQFNYDMFKIARYENTSSVNFEAGFIFHMSDQLQAGVHVSVIDFFPSPQMRNAFIERLSENDTYLHSYPDQNHFNQYFNYDFGCGQIRPAYMVHLQILMASWKKKLFELHAIGEERFDSGALEISKDFVSYQNIHAGKIIFCDGVNGIQNPWFELLPYAPNKGLRSSVAGRMPAL